MNNVPEIKGDHWRKLLENFFYLQENNYVNFKQEFDKQTEFLW
jgi:hypothetical protein